MKIQKLSFGVLSLSLFFICCQSNNVSNIDWESIEEEFLGEDLMYKSTLYLKSNLPKLYSFKNYLVKGEDTVYVTSETDSLGISKLLNRGYKVGHEVHRDESILNTSYIKNYIHQVCENWKSLPWHNEVPDSIFLKYVLPYKIGAEYPDNWRESVLKKLGDSINAVDSSYFEDKRKFIDKTIKKKLWPIQDKWYHYSDEPFPFGGIPSFNELKGWGRGNCYIGSQLSIYFARTIGIPMGLDFIPYFGGINGSHSFEVHWDPETNRMLKFRPFDIPVTKVYRRTFEPQSTWADVKESWKLPNFDIEFLKSDHVLDVTDRHVVVKDVIVTPPKNVDVKHAYLGVYSYGNWIPIQYATLSDMGNFRFGKMGVNIFYKVLFPEVGLEQYDTPVFYLNYDGMIIWPFKNEQRVNMSLNAINHGRDAYVRKNRFYTLYALAQNGKLIPLETKKCEKDSVLNFVQVPHSKFYVLKPKGSQPVDYARFFALKNGNQDWLIDVNSIRYPQLVAQPYQPGDEIYSRYHDDP
ncbi:hypothetical protein [Olivibacter sitiensis]|uniref:hypothetical protein n=1 Tax=Olivibacter sitiensis TaxID=376470 RepID=UPI0012F9C9AF|nr:hypothetical protein [Olivibacter sitiensis]